jgi:hypothetical protein
MEVVFQRPRMEMITSFSEIPHDVSDLDSSKGQKRV